MTMAPEDVPAIEGFESAKAAHVAREGVKSANVRLLWGDGW